MKRALKFRQHGRPTATLAQNASEKGARLFLPQHNRRVGYEPKPTITRKQKQQQDLVREGKTADQALDRMIRKHGSSRRARLENLGERRHLRRMTAGGDPAGGEPKVLSRVPPGSALLQERREPGSGGDREYAGGIDGTALRCVLRKGAHQHWSLATVDAFLLAPRKETRRILITRPRRFWWRLGLSRRRSGG